MSDLSVLFNQACNTACSLAAIYPKNMPNYDDCVPGTYGTFNDGIWVKQGDIATDFKAQFTVPDPGAYAGKGSWSSDKMNTAQVSLQGGVWVADEGAGDGQLGMKYSSQNDVLFHVATSGLYVQEMTTDVLTQISGAVRQLKNYNQLRFVVKLLSANTYVSFGGQQKGAYCVLTGTAQALEDSVAGSVSGSLNIASTNVSEINQTISATSQLVPVAFLLYEISEHHGIVPSISAE